MNLKLRHLRTIAQETLSETKALNEMKAELRRVFGPATVTEAKDSAVASYANSVLDAQEASGKSCEMLGLKPMAFLKTLTHSDPGIRKLSARLAPLKEVRHLVFDDNDDVRLAAAKRLPRVFAEAALKKYPDDFALEALIEESKDLQEAGLPDPEKRDQHLSMYKDRLGDVAKQKSVPELSDVWYEDLAKKFAQDYGKNIEFNWEEKIVANFCSGVRAQTGVVIDPKRLLKAVKDLINDKEEKVLDESLEEALVLPLMVEEKKSSRQSKMLTSVSSITNLTALSESLGVEFKPASLFVKARLIEEGMNSRVMLPNRVVFKTMMTSDDETDLDKFTSLWNIAAKRENKPLRISWVNESNTAVTFNVEVL